MPWSGRRAYDVDVAGAEKETAAALDELRAKGAKHLFVAGHSQGGVFALYLGGRAPLDGVIAIAPGGNVASPSFRDQLSADVARAREMVADGKGGEKGRFSDFEGSRGGFAVSTTAASYLSWFDPDGAMNAMKSARSMNPRVAVLYIAPRNDYLALARAKSELYGALPANPLTRLAEPNAGHLEAPAASLEPIDQWLKEVTAALAK
jgi:pimeloyl-ACP methyl ester carboxylesterase